ncbi:Metallo-dependent phosphatase-like protein [Amanita muscaria]
MSPRFVRGVGNALTNILTITGIGLLLTYVFILYQPTFGPGAIQKLGWQSWDVIVIGDSSDKPQTTTSDGHTSDDDKTVDWWNVTKPNQAVDTTSFPLDIWAPLLPHDAGLAEITVTHCYASPYFFGDLCAPRSTPEQDAIKGKWVRVPRNLNIEAGYASGYLEMYYRRTRRQDVNLIDDIRLLPSGETPSPSQNWFKVEKSLRAGRFKAPPLFMWYHLGKTAAEMTREEKANIVTELDVLFGDDRPWYGFERLHPPTFRKGEPMVAVWITYRKGVKIPPRAPPLHFSRSGKFKILQVADLHYSVSQGTCLDTPKPCSNSDNLTNSLLMRTLDKEKPDLVVFSGDQLNGRGMSWDPRSVLAKFARAVTDRNIPWAAVFGNHDAETGATREEQLEMMKALPYSLVERGPKDIHGVGNYVLKVMSADASKTHLLTLYFLDSGAYAEGLLSWLGFAEGSDYDWIHEDQINWFLQNSASIDHIERPFHPDTGKDLATIWPRQSDQLTPVTRKLAKPNALMFFHIPLPEAFYKADTDPRTGKTLDIGTHGLEGPGNAKHNGDFFEKGVLQAKENDRRNSVFMPEVKVVANGHDHITDNCRRVQGIWMCFGGGGSFSGYGKIGFDRRHRVYEISDYGETIRTYKRTEEDEIIDSMMLAGRGAPAF